MQLHDLKPPAGSTHRRKIVGRGPGSGHGKTSGRGHKGNKARGQVNPNFEGGQTPLHRRLPQVRGFKPVNKVIYAVVNVGDLERYDAGTEVTPELLLQRGVLRRSDESVKILGDGRLTKPLTVRAHRFSKSAIEKLQAAGGKAEVL
ncbi:MAG: 50S ribosomal protein L15 [Chthonomonadales bacterium]|nr:50S ribosomal protein L15 [Chthonomonadales bacterium]